VSRRIWMVVTASALVATITVAGAGGALGASRILHTTHGTRSALRARGRKTACHLWAVVNSDGSLARSGCSGTTSHTSIDAGDTNYDVLFTKSVKACAFNATVGSSASSGTVPPGLVAATSDVGVVGEGDSPDGVFIEAFNSSGTPTPEGFHLSVTCGHPKSPACDTWANVKSSGKLVRSGCTGTTSTGTGGSYDVVFTTNVQSCAYQATIGTSHHTDTSPKDFVAVAGDPANGDGVFVETFNSSGVETPEYFQLSVTCGHPKSPACDTWAVVNSDASLASTGCSGASSTTAGRIGTYDVVFTKNVTDCAYTATIGSAGSSGSVAPGFVAVVGEGGNADGVYVETFNSSGVETQEGFHLTVVC